MGAGSAGKECGRVPDAVRAAWTIDPEQAERALASLLADGLVRELPDGRLAL